MKFKVLMLINGRSVLVTVSATTCVGVEGVVLKFSTGTEIVFEESAVNEMIASAQALKSGKRTNFVPAS